ncbi:MAG TPA: polysaccharide biosynthesis/export family protein [Candidatus Aquilonibacter sp.]|nr:polysaccharide biosynthesis/export family protein [Candidatus Aquilonibacter sp.]
MKNFVSKKELLALLAAARWMMPLLAALFVITGCATDQVEYPAANPSAHQSSDTLNQAQSEPIILRDGDTVSVSFPGSPSLNTTQLIRRDGKIVMPLIGEVDAAGKTPEDLQNDLIKLYAPQMSTKQIIVTVQSSSFQVYVTGAVLRPGPVTVDHPISALEAIMQAGGFDLSQANLKAVVVVRQEKDRTVRYTLNLKKVLQGTQGEPFYLKPSDIVFVPQKFTWF